MDKNILFFMVDQLSAKWLELAARRGIVPLPNIKGLAANGTWFTNVITSNPVCCPARATIATGLTTRGHGVLENGYRLDPELPTFMRALQKKGYVTGALGKVHFEPHFQTFWPDYKKYGFDVTHITEDGRGGEWLDWVRDSHPGHYEDVLACIWASYIPEYAAYGPDKTDLGGRIREIQKGYNWSTADYPEGSFGAHSQKYPQELTQTEWITRHALDFISGVPEGKPFFAHVSYVQPHFPFTVPAGYLPLVKEELIPEALPAEWRSDPFAPAYFSRQKMQRNNEYDKSARKCYFADLAHLDGQLGRLVALLKDRGVYDNTYIIFISDHGELLGDHEFYGKEERHYDACIRVPLIISGPGLGKGGVCSQFVQHEDVCPTILDMAGAQMEGLKHTPVYLQVPEEKLRMSYGRSLLGYLKGEKGFVRDDAYCESFSPIWSIDYTDWARTVRTEQYRYTYYAGNTGEQLFELSKDPDEQRNLAGDPEYAGVKRDLKDRLLEYLIRQDWPKTPRELYSLGVH